MALSLLILGPEGSAKWWPLRSGPIRVGRGKANDLVIVGRGVSRNHAVMELEGETLRVQDLDSTYGTKINGRQLRRAAVSVGDHVDIGVFRFVLAPRVEEMRPEETSGIPSIRRGQVTDQGSRGRWDEPTVGILTTAELDLTFSGIPGTDPGYLAASSTASFPTVRRVGEANAEQPSDPQLGVRLVAEPVTLDDALDAAGANEPMTSAVEGMASNLRREGGPGATNELGALDALLAAHAVAQQLAATTTLSAFLDEALSVLVARLGADSALLIQRQETGKLRVISARHRHGADADDLPVSRSIVDQALSTGRPQQSAHFHSDPHVGRHPSVMAYRSGALLALPLILPEARPGVICLARRAGRPFDRLQVETVQAVSGILGRCLVLRSLEQSGARDRSRRAMLERFHAPETLQWIYEAEGHTARRRHTVTALHVEMSGLASTLILQGADKAADLLESLRGLIQQAVTGHGGALLDLRDESALALFGLSDDDAMNDASWAAAAAREMLREFRNLARHAKLPPALGLRLGLDRGEVLEALLGPTDHLLHTALGGAALRARDAARAVEIVGIRATGEVLEHLPGGTSSGKRVAPEDTTLDVPLYDLSP